METTHSTAQVNLAEFKDPFSKKNKLGRALWNLVWLFLFRPSPRRAFGWRCWLLRLFGAKIGQSVWIYPTAKVWAPWNLEMHDYSTLASDVDCYCMGKVLIGEHAIVSQYSYLCAGTHDITDPKFSLKTSPITIEKYAWVCAQVFIGPGVTLGEGAVAGARAAVFKNVEPWTVVGGNPAKFIKKREIRAVSEAN